MTFIRFVAVTAVAALVAGCASMAGIAPQATPQGAARIGAARTLADVQLSAASWPRADWWTSYADPQLDALMSEALAQSPTLAVAAARTRKAIAATEAAQANRGPRVDGTLSSTRERFSKHAIYPPPLGGSTQTVNGLQATLDWAVDFWGRDREAYEAALGARRAAEVDAYAARLALSTGVALAYAELQHGYLQREVADAMLREREATLKLTRDRVAAGLDSRIEQKQAEAALPATREQIAALDERIQLARNALAALLGAGPDRGRAIARPTASALATVALPSRVPAELLGRRPDIVAQRWRIEAARHSIASAKAQFYPNVNLVAFVGLQALGGAHLLNAASGMLGAGPAVSLPIFDAGRLRANLASTDADYDIAVGQYNQLLADAMRDVVDQIASLQSVAAQREEQRQALATAREALDLALLRYREGLGNYLQVLSAEQPLFAEQEHEADLRARELTLSIQLVRALGGGFDPAGTAPAALAAGGTP